jgi:hypothetical protein
MINSNVLTKVTALLRGKVDEATLSRVLEMARASGVAGAQDEPQNGDLIEALQAFALELTGDQAAKLNNLIEAHNDPRAAVAGQSESDPNSPNFKGRAMDAASRRRGAADRYARGAPGFARRYPDAGKIKDLG